MRRTAAGLVVIGLLSFVTATGAIARAPSPALDVEPPRVELPDARVAISIPSDWEHHDATEYREGWWDPDYGAPEEQFLRFLGNGGLLRARTKDRTDRGHQQCDIYDYTDFAMEDPAWVTIEDAMDYYTAIDVDEGRATAFEADFVDLPVGRVLRMDTLHSNGWDWRDYLFTDGWDWLMLVCGSTVPPDDRWLSIAETFEFLPEEE